MQGPARESKRKSCWCVDMGEDGVAFQTAPLLSTFWWSDCFLSNSLNVLRKVHDRQRPRHGWRLIIMRKERSVLS